MKINPILRVGVAGGCVAYGFAVDAFLPSFGVPPDAAFYAGLTAKILGVVFAIGACIVENTIVFKIGWLWWTMRDLSRHVSIVGDTGSGKTEGAMKLILRQYLKNVPRGAALVIGTKGDEAEFAQAVAARVGRSGDFRLLEVRPDNPPPGWKPPAYYNFLSDRTLPWTAHAKAIVDTASALTEGQQSSFFKPSAQKGIAYGLRIMEALGRDINLTELHNLLTNRAQLAIAVGKFRDFAVTSPNFDANDLNIIEFFQNEFIAPKGQDQSAGQEATIGLFLSPFLQPEIREVFCSSNPNTFEISDYDKGMILATSIPQRFYSERQFVHTYLKTLSYYHALRRLDKSHAVKKTFQPIGCFGDEFQDLTTASEDGMADHKVADRVRAAKFFIVAATQSEVSADPKIGEEKRKVLTKNLRTKFYFRQADKEDAEIASNALGTKMVTRRFRNVTGVLDFDSTGNKEEVPKVRPDKLLNLPDFTAYVIHPSPQFLGARYIRAKLPPRNADGSIPSWYRFGKLQEAFRREN